jgi:subtilisin family serine protease
VLPDAVIADAIRQGADQAGRGGVEKSNRGAWVDVAAPGADLLAPSAGGSGYRTFTGTSFATAVVSGVAALVRQRYPDLTNEEVVRRIQGTAVSATGGRDERTGSGVVDPYLALTALDVPVPPAEVPSARGGSIPLVPLPAPDDPWRRTGRTAAGATGILLLVAVIVVLVGTARRRIAVRRDVPGAVEEAADLHRPVPEMPAARLDT